MAIKLNSTSGSVTLDAEDGSGNVNVTVPRAGFYSAFVLEDDDGTEVSLSDAEEVKFIGSGITTNWTDTSHGSDGDPFDMTFTVDAAQTGITSIYATDLILGEDTQTAIDFGTANEIDFKVDNATRLTMTSGALYPITTNQIDLGTASLEFKDAYFDGTVTSDAFAGPLTGNVTGNVSGTAGSATGNAATATALATARTIGGTSFDGTADIAVGLAATVTTNANLTGHVTSTGNAAVLGSFTSAQLSTALSDETGSGAAVFATSPTLVTPALGTPASGTLTNVSGLPAAGVVGTAATEGAANTFSALQTFSGSSSALATKIQSILENATISATAATGTVIFSLLTQSVLYYTTNASGNFTVNFRGDGSNTLNSLMAVGDVITCAFLATCGSTAYYNNVVHVDSSSVTPKWQGGTAPSAGNASSVDIYSYTIVKTANATFSIFAAQTQFA